MRNSALEKAEKSGSLKRSRYELTEKQEKDQEKVESQKPKKEHYEEEDVSGWFPQEADPGTRLSIKGVSLTPMERKGRRQE